MNTHLYIEKFFLKNGMETDTEHYPFNIPVIRNFRKLEFHKPVTFIIGENGTGKSTLLEAFAVAYGFNPEGGSRNFNFSTLQNRLGGNGVYMFDEPEAALSPMRLLALLVRMDELVKANSQFIISTHSPIVMMYPDADIYEIEDGKLQLAKLENTRHFVITKYCIQNRDKILAELGVTTN
ncbi:MAG: AAA family ATPase [Prevotellaceae bacterium]|jgi:predicted ATPase|nr:AAA family ATPase [Prevotellaceae bacterium]